MFEYQTLSTWQLRLTNPEVANHSLFTVLTLGTDTVHSTAHGPKTPETPESRDLREPCLTRLLVSRTSCLR